MMYGDTHYHGEYADVRHEHRGDYAEASHDHYLDYAEKYHQHHDIANLIAILTETLDSAATAIRDLRGDADRLEVAQDRTGDLLQHILRRLEALEDHTGVTPGE